MLDRYYVSCLSYVMLDAVPFTISPVRICLHFGLGVIDNLFKAKNRLKKLFFERMKWSLLQGRIHI